MSVIVLDNDTLRYAAAWHQQHRDRVPMWVITERPSDYPQGYVARLHLTLPTNIATSIAIKRPSIADVRAHLPDGLVKISPSPGDDPCIVEIWI
jgi:hypothetical protein